MYNLRKYQVEIAEQIHQKLKKYNICYLAAEVRVGKSLMSLEACKLYGANKVLFLTKKKAISSILSDYSNFNYNYDITVINYESVHKVLDNDFDIVVYDEAHLISAFPKPSKRAKDLKKRFSKIPAIYLSGTPAIESYSQWYHQFYVSDYSPFKSYSTFYRWAKHYVDVEKRNFGYAVVSDYSNAKVDKITKDIEHLLITFTQEQANFKTTIKENILYCEMKESTYKLSKKLIKDRVVEGKTDVIIADTAVKLASKVHQIMNGSVIGESGDVIILDNTKARFIKDQFKGKKLGIFYYFKGEAEILKSVFGDEVTTDLEEFNNSNKHIMLQQSGVEGMNLSKADYLIFYNFGFSGKNWTQSLDRLTTIDRQKNEVYLIFANNGINEKIYKRVSEKKNYNKKIFLQDFVK